MEIFDNKSVNDVFKQLQNNANIDRLVRDFKTGTNGTKDLKNTCLGIASAGASMTPALPLPGAVVAGVGMFGLFAIQANKMRHKLYREHNAKAHNTDEKVKLAIELLEKPLPSQEEMKNIINQFKSDNSKRDYNSATSINLRDLLLNNTETTEAKINGIRAVLEIAKRNPEMRGRRIITDICKAVREANTLSQQASHVTPQLN